MMYVGQTDLGIDDSKILDAMSKNAALSSFGALSGKLSAIQSSYENYRAASGDAWKLSAPLSMPAVLVNALKAHYENEIKGLEFISIIREKLRDDCCPMCGSTLPPDEIDHVIPKNIYPEYSVFSHNLVPACKCNRKKGQVYKGLVPPERVLHPYYDKLMQHRLVYLSFEKGIEKPEIDVVLAAPHDENETLKFHVEKILKKTTLLRYAENAWAKFSDLPRLTLRSFKKVSGPINVFDFREEMEALVEESDYKHGTPNNWQSMFHYGLLHSPLHLDFVHQQLNQGR